MIYFTILLALFVLFTFVNILTMPRLSSGNHHLTGKVSVLVPLRNEERNVKGLINCLKELTYPSIEFILLDDHSTDKTLALLHTLTKNDNRFSIKNGKELKKGWVGKVHACHQLGHYASGDYFLFLDADVRVKPAAIEQAMHVMEKFNSRLVTGFPQFPVRPFVGRLLVPLQHFFIFFHLPNLAANRTTWEAFTAAHGAFMFFEKEAYVEIGGHESVKSSLIEDIAITRKLKKHGFKATLANVTPSVTCFMYETNKEVWEGFLKNIYTGLGKSITAAIGVSLFYLLFYAGPFVLAITGFIMQQWFLMLPLLFVWLQAAIIDFATKGSRIHFLLMPLSAIALTALIWSSVVQSIRKKGYVWKGRTYQ
ncbi:glycosyltransferase [Jeotgalibacillus proteolyticus]|uniref:Glycosyl transferase family 2 n=1 Tax=Jeotgalibacillus proteolyticus TaxID=2082395 RepID=A0A2S5GDR6_9BACL|nr:glycosyltransferase family 2 protein [Jeotgalibacillus proteolyticus]PPA71182.1 glycosyl transferase family 2 [Jeotgalibacillus proteolyticus]